ncbi:MAG: metallophosphoesterase family protein, partial [Thermoleophilia bacterium]|nr:metallophosphoesterase family protein [Thermoleophilia bacterium]
MSLIGLLSDTHGQVPAQVVALFSGVDHIVHAGDIGSQDVLLRLQQIAPVTAVRGNCDLDDWAKSLPLRTELNIAGLSLVVAHMPGRLQVPLTTLAGTLSKSAVPAGWEGVLGPSPSREGSRQAPLVGVVGHSHVPA